MPKEPIDAPGEYLNLALAHEERCEWGHAIQIWSQAAGKGLDEVALACQIAMCLCYAGHVEEGLLSLERVAAAGSISLETSAHIELIRSWLLLRADRRGESATARLVSERVLATPLAGLPPEKEYSGQAVAGMRLLVLSYGGAGDQIQYSRYLYALLAAGCAELTVVVHPGLETLFRENFRGIKLIVADDAWIDTSAVIYDYWFTFITLAAHFGFDPQPAYMPPRQYLTCPEDILLSWRTWVEQRSSAGAWRLGLNWQGLPGSDARFFRASSARDFAQFTSVANTASFCLNRDLTLGSDGHTEHIIFPGQAISDFLDLSGLILSMDMIVTTCTAQAHLAGALGAPVILLLSPKPDARWGGGERTALYPNTHIVRATRAGKWEDAIDKALTLIYLARVSKS